MGEFFEPQGDGIISPPKVFTQNFMESVIKKELADGNIPADHKLAFVAAVNEEGVKGIIAVKIVNKEDVQVKFNAIFEHDWDGDNKAGAKVIFSMR